jgi:hypothetical protein
MRCESCKFENIPGQNTCIKCGSALVIKSVAFDIHPPRMSKWKKPFRGVLRSMRKGKIASSVKANAKPDSPSWVRELFSDELIGLVLCIIPGLGHLVRRRFREVRWYFAAWLILLASGLFCYGSPAGFICIGLAVGVHVGIAVQYGLLKRLDNPREKAVMLILALIGLTLLYRYSSHILFPNLVGGYSSLTIPSYNVVAGDYLLARSHVDQNMLLPRGSLVLIHPVTVGGHYGVGTAAQGQSTTIGEIVGLPGENIGIIRHVFVVNGRELNTEQYPVPKWLQNRNFFSTIPENHYFVSTRYSVAVHGLTLTRRYIEQVCLIATDDIEARAFLRWWPLARRGFLP